MTEKKSKIVSVALIVLMLGAIFGALPGATSGASEIENGTIVLFISDDNGPVPVDYEVDVYCVDNNSMDSYYLNTEGYIEISVPPGYYEVTLPVQRLGANVYFENDTGALKIEEGASETRSERGSGRRSGLLGGQALANQHRPAEVVCEDLPGRFAAFRPQGRRESFRPSAIRCWQTPRCCPA